MGVANRGYFVTFDGVDGTGKSGAVEAVATRLRALYPETKVVTVKAPSPRTFNGKLREALLSDPAKWNCPVDLWYRLFATDLLITGRTVVRPALDEGAIVLADRWKPSYYIYGQEGWGLPFPSLRKWMHEPDTLWGDLSVIFDGDPTQLSDHPSHFQTPEFYKRVREGFLHYSYIQLIGSLLIARSLDWEDKVQCCVDAIVEQLVHKRDRLPHVV